MHECTVCICDGTSCVGRSVDGLFWAVTHNNFVCLCAYACVCREGGIHLYFNGSFVWFIHCDTVMNNA